MKNQYFGDRRDLFKYDLLLDLVEAHGARRLTLVPMLTPPDESGEGRLTAADKGARRPAVYEFLQLCVRSGQRDIRRLRDLIPTFGVAYMPFRDDAWFVSDARPEYFRAVPPEYLANSVVFFDPDIGLETGTHSYMRKTGPEKYLMYSELADVWTRVSEDSVVVVYQHLQNDATKRTGDVRRRVTDLRGRLKAQALAVHWNDLAFVAVARNDQVARKVRAALEAHAQQHRLVFCDGAA